MTSSSDRTTAALHRARTALRQAAIDHAVWRARRVRPGRRSYQQAGRDALQRIDAAITYLHSLRDLLAAALHDETADADREASAR
ncbi:hypothetical protein [Actinoallomurus sp. NPDC052274]|uniref:hypothetical protein n=1 Tax=Actinoallomurus sp. NPDC052274 TaxID=3155420 RepID=UPI003421C4E3